MGTQQFKRTMNVLAVAIWPVIFLAAFLTSNIELNFFYFAGAVGALTCVFPRFGVWGDVHIVNTTHFVSHATLLIFAAIAISHFCVSLAGVEDIYLPTAGFTAISSALAVNAVVWSVRGCQAVHSYCKTGEWTYTFCR